MNKNMYITTPIYYVNGNPHVGHAHTSVMGDILKREYISKGYTVFFTTGIDEHGQKNQSAIEASGLSAAAYLDKQSAVFSGLFDLLNVGYDRFVRTTGAAHKQAVRHVLDIVYKKGLIIKKEYEGLYCVGCEMFKTNADLDENGLCVDHQTRPVLMKESNYFFTLGAYQEWLTGYIENHPSWIQPEHYRKEILHLLKEPLPDLCISRTKERCSLGIDLPFDSQYVTYVWFDALVNYISSLGYPDTPPSFYDNWNACTHLMAKDIIKTHCIYWPIMLKAIGLEPQYQNFVHGYWTGAGGIKMSKTIGNVVDPFKVAETFGADPFRYFLARAMGENESPVSYELIKNCYNTELVNTISNGLYRTMKLAYKKFNGVYPQTAAFRAEDDSFLNAVFKEAGGVIDALPSLARINSRARKINDIGKMINAYLDKSAPWNLIDAQPPDAFDSCIMTCAEAFRLLAETASPVMPDASQKIITSLGAAADRNKPALTLRALRPNSAFPPPSILFKRMQ